jgi:hypothetical protein
VPSFTVSARPSLAPARNLTCQAAGLGIRLC